VLLLATVDDRRFAVGALAILAVFTAVSMTLMTTAFGLVLGSSPVRRTFNGLAPVLGLLSVAFGIWYALGALQLAPYML
jgi:uncharacterized BrkB/YihY/UPF0761 family membrane protein